MRKSFLYSFLILFSLVTASCGISNQISAWTEPGTITIVSPKIANYYDLLTQGGVVLDVVIESTHPTEKSVVLMLDKAPVSSCLVPANTKVLCGQVRLISTGQHVITAGWQARGTGEMLYEEVSVNWRPYTALDLKVGNFADVTGRGDPVTGYKLLAWISLIAVCLSAVFLGRNKFWAGLITTVIAIPVISLVLLLLNSVVSGQAAFNLFGWGLLPAAFILFLAIGYREIRRDMPDNLTSRVVVERFIPLSEKKKVKRSKEQTHRILSARETKQIESLIDEKGE